MADSPCFDLTCEMLERDTSLDRLEARGTLRLSLKAAGLNAGSVSPEQMVVVVDNLLPRELEARGVDNGDRVCAALKRQLAGMETPDLAETPEAVFARLGGD
jgi:hypothetical protein